MELKSRKMVRKRLRALVSWFSRFFAAFRPRHTVPVAWVGGQNWGDKLTPFLTRAYFGKVAYKPVFSFSPRLVVVGSILGSSSAHGVVWGGGFISYDSVPNGLPERVCAVRGPLSRDIYVKHNIECPEVYGDPAILISSAAPMARDKKFRYGLIPHYIDKRIPWLEEQFIRNPSVLIIDIEGDVLKVAEQVASCEFVYSSSLHGLVCADAYNVPNTRIVMSDNIRGGDFKFLDYRLGIGAEPHVPIDVRSGTFDLASLEAHSSVADVGPATEALLAAAPYPFINGRRFLRKTGNFQREFSRS